MIKEINKRLDDIGLSEPGRANCQEVRAAAQRYFMSLIMEDIALCKDMPGQDSFDSAEGMMLGFVAGYEACLHSHPY
jgi:hypothetical protein